MLMFIIRTYETRECLYFVHYLNASIVMINNNFTIDRYFNNPTLGPLSLGRDKSREWRQEISQFFISVRSYIAILSEISIVSNENIWAAKRHKISP